MNHHFRRLVYGVSILCGALLGSQKSSAQEIKIFTTRDFDLLGKVKSCLVLTDYGKEEFEFNRDGLLTKSVTRYNDNDYSITYYKYRDGHMAERRDEVYRDGAFDANSSIAHFFNLDTVPGKRITEQIVTYNKEFLDRYEYYFDEDNKLVRILRSSNEGIDETRVDYSTHKGEFTTTYFLNEVLQKTVRESFIPAQGGGDKRILLTKEYINGVPDKALEQTFDAGGNLVTEQRFEYSQKEKSFVPVSRISYEYGDNQQLSNVSTTSNGQKRSKNYIFQYDPKGNWIKQIITPENAYTTRKIEYYLPDKVEDRGGE